MILEKINHCLSLLTLSSLFSQFSADPAACLVACHPKLLLISAVRIPSTQVPEVIEHSDLDTSRRQDRSNGWRGFAGCGRLGVPFPH